MQPGRSGTYAEKLAPASSITIAYRIGESRIFKACLFKDTVEGAWCQVVRKLAGYRDVTGLTLVLFNLFDGDRVEQESEGSTGLHLRYLLIRSYRFVSRLFDGLERWFREHLV